jgi:hypothetical protein
MSSLVQVKNAKTLYVRGEHSKREQIDFHYDSPKWGPGGEALLREQFGSKKNVRVTTIYRGV